MAGHRETGPGRARAATLYDVARAARVSTATVSRVVHGHDPARPATRRRVLEAIEELDYMPRTAMHSSFVRGRVPGLGGHLLLLLVVFGDDLDEADDVGVELG